MDAGKKQSLKYIQNKIKDSHCIRKFWLVPSAKADLRDFVRSPLNTPNCDSETYQTTNQHVIQINLHRQLHPPEERYEKPGQKTPFYTSNPNAT